jgi:hypothetical protein
VAVPTDPDLARLAEEFDWFVPARSQWASVLAQTSEDWARMLAFVRSRIARGVPADRVVGREASIRLPEGA